MSTPIPSNSASFTLGQVAAATGGRLVAGDPDRQLSGVSTDSRSTAPGNLFVALRGEKFDGHAFIERAVSGGAGGVLVQQGAGLPPEAGAVVADDTLRAMGELAAVYRSRFDLPLVAVTGSMGKTSCKEMIGAALSASGMRVLCSQGNLNNLIGAPMTLFQLSGDWDAAVLELGSSNPGEIARLAEITRPEVGVVTAVAAAHTEHLGTVEQVAREKAALLLSLGPGTAAVFNADSAHLQPFVSELRTVARIGFGRSEKASVRLLEQSINQRPATLCRYRIEGLELDLEAELALLGEGAAMNAAAALAVVLALCGILGPADSRDGEKLEPRERLRRALGAIARVQPVAGRLRPVPGPRGSLLLDDTYNCNPESAIASLAAAARLARVREGRAIAILGDMAELGRLSRAEHERVGREAARLKTALLIACGPRMLDAAEAAEREALLSPAGERTRVMRVEEPTAAAPLALEMVREGDVVLIKGSRCMAMERVLDELSASSGAKP